MELGISPVLTADWLVHILTMLRIIKFDRTLKEDYESMEGVSKSKEVNSFGINHYDCRSPELHSLGIIRTY
jgi:hypothetical protein